MNRKFIVMGALLLVAGCAGVDNANPRSEAACRAKAHASAVRQVTLDERNGDRAATGADDLQLREIEERETALCLEHSGA